MRGAETENRPPHGQELAQLELEPDQEQQHHDAELRHAQDAARRAEHPQPVRPDDDAGDQIGHDGGEPDPPRDRDAGHGGRQQHQRQREEAEFIARVVHDDVPDGVEMPGMVSQTGVVGDRGPRLRPPGYLTWMARGSGAQEGLTGCDELAWN